MKKTKICSKCKLPKELEEFNKNKRKKDGLTSWCKKCTSEISKTYYLNNTEKVLKSMKKSKEKINAWFIEFKQTLSCEKCGENHHSTLDFHHKDPKIKEFSISVMIRKNKCEQDIREELEKCIVLCSNCHRIFHYLEREEGVTIKQFLK